MNLLRTLSRTKLYWGLALICLIGALASPHTSAGKNIFLSYGKSYSDSRHPGDELSSPHTTHGSAERKTIS